MSLRNSPIPRILFHPENSRIDLTQIESTVCELLNGCANFIHQEKGISTTCRIAGGWVRDKLLGSQSNDIDVALSDIMGLAFAEHLTAFAQVNGVEIGAIAAIEQNPEQSKHLETATFKIFGLTIDLVNLRSEEYAEGSRIPTEISFGTPLQDALRRDMTINALFYNVHTRNVEDFTGKGLDDLRDGIIRTPLPPLETFLDDPLRVLRCIRFASRFGFDIVPELKEAARDPIVQNALATKIAHERVGDEVRKMMEGRDPLHSVKLIQELSLYDTIFFNISPEVKSRISKPFTPRPKDGFAAISILRALLNSGGSTPFSLHCSLQIDPTFKARLHLAAILTPFLGIEYRDHKQKDHPLVEAVIRDSLKLGTQNHYLDGILVLFAATRLIKAHITDESQHSLDRVRLGLLLRNKLVHNPNTGSHWTASLLFALVTELIPLYDVEKDMMDVEAASKIIQSYNSFVEKIHQLDLANDVEARPILNGREVVAALGVDKPGPWVGKVLDDVIEWQLGHPQQSKDDCLQWLTSQKNIYLNKPEPASKRSNSTK